MRYGLLFSLAALIAAPAAAQTAPSEKPETEGATIVVTGRSLADTDKALKACIARHCPPDQDVDATVAHAENQFVAGDYKGARSTLLAGRGRNKRFAKQYPVPVSDLLRANARVAAHLGEGNSYRISTIEMVEALKAGLPSEDPRVLGARVELADSLLAFGRIDYATDSYNAVIRDARRLKQPRVEGYAMLRLASLYTQLAIRSSAMDSTARDALDALTRSQVPEHQPFARAARVLRARLAAKRGDKGELDAVIADLRAMPTERPVLIYGEPIKMPDQAIRDDSSGSVTQHMQMNSVDGQWIDVSFWVAPDGRPTDAEILRSSGAEEPFWAKPVLAAIQTRRYLPLKREAGDPGILRVERYTYTARWTSATGTRMRVRSVEPRIEMLDLSVDEPAVAAAVTK